MASGKETFDAVKMIEAINRAYTPHGRPDTGEFGRSLQQIARLIKADAGVEAAFADIGGWDHQQHSAAVVRTGSASLAPPRGRSSATWAICMDDIVLVTMSGSATSAGGRQQAPTMGTAASLTVLGRYGARRPASTADGRGWTEQLRTADLAVTTDSADLAKCDRPRRVWAKLVKRSTSRAKKADRVFRALQSERSAQLIKT